MELFVIPMIVAVGVTAVVLSHRKEKARQHIWARVAARLGGEHVIPHLGLETRRAIGKIILVPDDTP